MGTIIMSSYDADGILYNAEKRFGVAFAHKCAKKRIRK
jgi:hypothetical protein